MPDSFRTGGFVTSLTIFPSVAEMGYNYEQLKTRAAGATNTRRPSDDRPGTSRKAATRESIAHPTTQSNIGRTHLSRRADSASGGFVLSPLREGATMPP